jgi:hypothetical protein
MAGVITDYHIKSILGYYADRFLDAPDRIYTVFTHRVVAAPEYAEK